MSLKRKSRPFGEWMGGNGPWVYPSVPVIEQQRMLSAPRLNTRGLFSLREAGGRRGGGWFASNHFKSGVLVKQRIIPWKVCQISFSDSPRSSLRAKTGPDLASALCLLGQLLRWSGSSAGSMNHLDFRWSRTAAIRGTRDRRLFSSSPTSFKKVFQSRGVGEVREHEGGERRGLMSLLVTSSVYKRYNWYNPTLVLPRRVRGKVLWVWVSLVCACVRVCVWVSLHLLLLSFFWAWVLFCL